MRDPERIDLVMGALRAYWKQNPDLRLCQIIGNCLNQFYGDSPIMDSRGYALEDDAFLRLLSRVQER